MSALYITEASTVQMPIVRNVTEVGWASLPHSRKAEVSR